jgi:hypothetical protein
MRGGFAARAIAAAKLIGLFAIALLLTVARIDPGLAREPTLATIVPIDLPDGQVGELRLFHGDGVYVADPVRLIVLDAAGHLVGYSHETFPISIICSAARKCVGYDHRNGVVLEFARTGNYLGPVISDGINAGLWFGPRNTFVNMHFRAPTTSEFAAANLQVVKDNYTDIALIFISGILMGALALALHRFGIRGGLGIAVRIVISIVALGLEFVLLILSFWPVFLGGISVFLWLMSLVLGLLCVVGAWLTLRFTRRKHRQAATA